jgi:hypothetical protein
MASACHQTHVRISSAGVPPNPVANVRFPVGTSLGGQQVIGKPPHQTNPSKPLCRGTSGLTALLPGIEAIPGVPTATVTEIQTDLATIQKDSAAIQVAVAANTNPSASTVQEIATVVGDVATVVLPAIPGGAAFVPAVQAAQALLPGILAITGVPEQPGCPRLIPAA